VFGDSDQWRNEGKAKGGGAAAPGRNSPGAQNGVKKKIVRYFVRPGQPFLLSV